MIGISLFWGSTQNEMKCVRTNSLGGRLLDGTLAPTLLLCASATGNLLHHTGIESNTLEQSVNRSHHIRDGSFRGQRVVNTRD